MSDAQQPPSGPPGGGSDPEKASEPAPPAASTSKAEAKEDVKMAEPEEEPLPQEILDASPEDIQTRIRLIDNDIKVRVDRLCIPCCLADRRAQVMRSEQGRLRHEHKEMLSKITDNSARRSLELRRAS